MSVYLIIFLIVNFICLFSFSNQKSCGKEDIGKIIMECDYNNQREIIFYWKNDCDQTFYKLPSKIISNDCSTQCNHSQFLDYILENNTQNKMTCSTCPSGYYNPAGNKIIKQWNLEVLKDFTNNCYTSINDDIKINQNCKKLIINSDGILSTPRGNNDKDALYSYELNYNARFINKGKITFSYRKDTFIDNKYLNGQFNFYLNYDLKLHDVNKEKKIQTVSYEVEKGFHSFMWQFNVWAEPNENKINSISFELISIEIEGLHHHEGICLICDENSKDYVNCKKCPKHSYFDNNESICKSCSENEYLLNSKSFSKEDCIIKPICNEDFIIEEHNEVCDENGMDIISYSYDSDKNCQVVSNLRNLEIEPQPSNDEPFDLEMPNEVKKDNINTNSQQSPTATIPKKHQNSTQIVNNYENHNSDRNHTLLEKGLLPDNLKEHCKPCPNGYKLTKESLNSSFTTCKECPDNKFYDTIQQDCIECHTGSYAIKSLSLSGHTRNLKNNFSHNICYTNSNNNFIENTGCPGWVFRSHGINSGVKLNSNSKKVLTKFINIDSSNKNYARLFLNFTIYQIKENQEFIMTLNDNEDKYTSEIKNRNFIKEFSLKEGKNTLNFIYLNKGEEYISKGDNYSVLINSIIIEGSQEGSGVKCSDCERDSLKLIIDGKTSCEPCEKGKIPNESRTECIKCTKYNISQNCLTCPTFTTKINESDCNLSNIIHNKKVSMKFDLEDFNRKNNLECENENEICYNKFLGPIRENNKNRLNDIFFISYAFRDQINITDFSFKTSHDYLGRGHVFALFNAKGHGLHYDDDKNDNKNDLSHLENTKVLKNVGSYISDVKIIPNLNEDQNENITNIFNNSGLMIEYSKGEYCNGSQRYKSYLFLYCDKENNHHLPKLVKKSENGCIFYFEMKSQEVCPLCTKSEAKSLYTACVNERRSIIFQEGNQCRIVKSQSIDNDYETDLSNILSFNETLENEELKYYFNIDLKQSEYYTQPNYKKIKEENLQLKDDLIYITKGNEIIEDCSNNSQNFSSNEYYLIFIIPLIWVVNIFLIIFCYCRYKSVKTDYQRLINDKENNQGINMSNLSQTYEVDNRLEI